MPEDISQLIVVPVVGTVVILLLLLFLLAFFFAYQRRQIAYKQERAQIHAKYAQEILQTQIEVQNATLLHIGQELHDNIGQLLAVTRMNLNILEESEDLRRDRCYILSANEVLDRAISDVRALAKSFDGESVRQFGLLESIAQELERINRTNRFITDLTVIGEAGNLGHEREIVLFRIFQELISNTIKHSRASHVKVVIEYDGLHFQLLFVDNGIGLDLNLLNKSLSGAGSGLKNIERRVALIGGHFEFKSHPGEGVEARISLQMKIEQAH